MHKTAICENCRDDKTYMAYRRKVSAKRNNIRFEYTEYYAICKTCLKEIYVSKLSDKSVINYNKAYEKAKKREIKYKTN